MKILLIILFLLWMGWVTLTLSYVMRVLASILEDLTDEEVP